MLENFENPVKVLFAFPPEKCARVQNDAYHLRSFTTRGAPPGPSIPGNPWIKEGLRRSLTQRGLFHFILVHSSIQDKNRELD